MRLRQSSGVMRRNGRSSALPALATTIAGAPQSARPPRTSPRTSSGSRHVAGDEAHLRRPADRGERLGARARRSSPAPRRRRGRGRSRRRRRCRRPVTSACWPASVMRHTLPSIVSVRSASRQSLVAAGQVGVAATSRSRSPSAARGAQRPVRVGEVRPGEADEVGAARHQDRVHVVGLVDVADRHRRDAGLVADAVGEGGLEHPPVDRLRAASRSARPRRRMMSTPAACEHAGRSRPPPPG